MKKPTTWRPNSRLAAPTEPVKRKTQVKKRRPDRIKKRREAAFGDKAEFVRSLPCVVLGTLYARGSFSVDESYALFKAAGCSGARQAMHIVSRGAGGLSKHLICACAAHHTESHLLGIKTFAANYGLNLTELAAYYESLWVSLSEEMK